MTRRFRVRKNLGQGERWRERKRQTDRQTDREECVREKKKTNI